MLRYLPLLLITSLVLALGAAGPSLSAPAATPGYKGVVLSTAYPSQTVRSGEPATLTLTVKNYGEPPQTRGPPGPRRARGGETNPPRGGWARGGVGLCRPGPGDNGEPSARASRGRQTGDVQLPGRG